MVETEAPLTLVKPPPSVTTPLAPSPDVVSEPPEIVVDPPAKVMTANIWSPEVAIVELVSLATPPTDSESLKGTGPL